MRSKSIVLIENDLNLRQSIALILQRAGFVVASTDCVHEAMSFLRSGSYQLVISDINIPDTSQVLIPEVHSRFPHISLVVLTDRALREHPKEYRSARAHYLVKPLAPERLLDLVGEMLGHEGVVNQPNNTIQPAKQNHW